MGTVPLQKGDKFPALQGRLIDGKLFTSSLLLGKRILYSFFRYTGCPACQVYFNQLQMKSDSLEQRNIHLVLIYEVEADLLQEMLSQGKNYQGYFISDPEGKLYTECSISRSRMGLAQSAVSSNFRDAQRQVQRDFSFLDLSRHGADASGRKDRMPAQFLVDAKGTVEIAYYGKNITDRLSLDKIL